MMSAKFHHDQPRCHANQNLGQNRLQLLLYHGFAVETSCCISDEPCQWERRQISTPTAPTFIDQSSWNSNLRNMSSRPPHMPNFVKIGIRVWVGRTPSLSRFGSTLCLFLFCLYTITPVSMLLLATYHVLFAFCMKVMRYVNITLL